MTKEETIIAEHKKRQEQAEVILNVNYPHKDSNIDLFDRKSVISAIASGIDFGILYADQQTASLKEENERLRNALAPLAELDLAGVTSGIIYQRNNSKILACDVRNAKSLLTKNDKT